MAGLDGCPPLDTEVWGTTDLREVLALQPWGFGFGPVVTLEDEARAAAAEARAGALEVMSSATREACWAPTQEAR